MRRLPLGVVWLLASPLLGAPLGPQGTAAPPTVQPFYERLLRQGSLALERKEFAEAEKDLRIASFGLLDHPETLIVGLVRLALAEQETGDHDGLEETLSRVIEVENRFGVYAKADLPPDLRTAFESLLVATLPPTVLSDTPAFQPLALRQEAGRIGQLPAADRRRELEQRIRTSPEEPLWRVLLGELELEQGHGAAAVAAAGAALALAPQDEAARCLHGRATAEEGRTAACATVVTDLALCGRSRTELAYAQPFLSCLLTLGRNEEARDLAAALPADVKDDKHLTRLLREAEKAAAKTPPAKSPSRGGASASTGAEGRGNGSRTADDPAAASGFSAEEAGELDRARALLAQARTTADLVEPFRLASKVADAHPTSREAQYLAGEISYRASRFEQALKYFDRGGEPDDKQPELLFYMAVSLFQSGEQERAAVLLKKALPHLRRTPFVEAYVKRILGGDG